MEIHVNIYMEREWPKNVLLQSYQYDSMNNSHKAYVSRTGTLVQHYLGWVFLE